MRSTPHCAITITIMHMVSPDFKHVWVYQQWSAQIGETGYIAGRQHTDTDGIPDLVESDRSPGSIGARYEFSSTDPDSFGISVLPEWSIYAKSGDQEILAREEGITNPRATHPERDWSQRGTQWDH